MEKPMAFGRVWNNEAELRQLCKDALDLMDDPKWAALERVLALEMDSVYRKLPSCGSFPEVRYCAGKISQIENIFALRKVCEQFVKKKAT